MTHLTSLQPYTLHPYVFEMNRGRGQRNSIYNINIIYTISLNSFSPTFRAQGEFSVDNPRATNQIS